MNNKAPTNKNPNLKDKFDHLWKYFKLHANQRIILIRYYIIFFTIYVTGSGYLLVRFKDSGYIEEFCVIFLSIIFISITNKFKSIDNRNRELIHLAENSLIEIEKKGKFNESEKIFTKEKNHTYNSSTERHTRSFKGIFNIATGAAITLILVSIFLSAPEICSAFKNIIETIK